MVAVVVVVVAVLTSVWLVEELTVENWLWPP